MSILRRIGAGLIFVLGTLAMIFRANAKTAKAEKRVAEQRAKSAEAVIQANERARENLQRLNKQHEQEDKADAQSIEAGRRDHFDDTW